MYTSPGPSTIDPATSELRPQKLHVVRRTAPIIPHMKTWLASPVGSPRLQTAPRLRYNPPRTSNPEQGATMTQPTNSISRRTILTGAATGLAAAAIAQPAAAQQGAQDQKLTFPTPSKDEKVATKGNINHSV